MNNGQKKKNYLKLEVFNYLLSYTVPSVSVYLKVI